MNVEFYQRFFLKSLEDDKDFEAVFLPIIQDNQQDQGELILEWLLSNEFIIKRDNMFFVDRDKVYDFNPNLLKILDVMMLSEFYSTIDSLSEKGLIEISIDENGEMIYSLTEIGKMLDENNQI